MEISYSAHNTGKILFCYTSNEFSSVVSRSIGLDSIRILIMLCCPTNLPMKRAQGEDNLHKAHDVPEHCGDCQDPKNV